MSQNRIAMYRNLCRLTDSYRPELFFLFCVYNVALFLSLIHIMANSSLCQCWGGVVKSGGIYIPASLSSYFISLGAFSFFVYYAVLFLSLIYVMVNNSLCQCWGGVVKSGGIYTPVGFSSYFMHDLFWYVWLNFQSFNHSLNIWFDLGVFKSVASTV